MTTGKTIALVYYNLTIFSIVIHSVYGGFLVDSDGKEPVCNANLGLIPGSGRSPGEGNSYSLQYLDLENSMDCIDHGVTKSWT